MSLRRMADSCRINSALVGFVVFALCPEHGGVATPTMAPTRTGPTRHQLDYFNFKRIEEALDLEWFNATSLQDIIDSESAKLDDIFHPIGSSDYAHQSHRNRRDDAVMYMPLGDDAATSSGVSCPTQDDANLVSLTQMAFLSMTVSIFSLVAAISNNLNNNNNNNNNNNVNFVNQKNNNLNMNQNIVNQINIDLPPPVPGRKRRRRSPREVELENRLRKELRRSTDEYNSPGKIRSDYTLPVKEL